MRNRSDTGSGTNAPSRGRTRRAVLGGLAGATAFSLAGCLGDGGGGGIESESLPDRGDEDVIADVQTFPNEGVEHVESGTEVEYDTRPPTSGPHYSGTVSAGFYESPRTSGNVVHTLEHGAVVIYYQPDALTDDARSSLTAWANNHTGTWQSIVVAPYGYDDPESPYTLTTWRHMLQMDEYDAEVVRAFCAEYLGRGPENAVR